MTETRPSGEDSALETPNSDRAWLETLRKELEPAARSASERAAFRMRLEERIERRRRTTWRPGAVLVTAAVVVTLWWFAIPGGRGDSTERTAQTRAVTGESGLLSYAYYETDYLASGGTGTAILSDEYQAIASAFDVP